MKFKSFCAIFSRSKGSERKKAWTVGELDLPQFDGYYEVVFEGLLGDPKDGNDHIALDDIVAFPGQSCGQVRNAAMTTTPTPTTVPVETTTAIPSTPVKFACDFERDMCEWRDTELTKPQATPWQRHTGHNATFDKAPLNDVTLRSSHGHYAYVGGGGHTTDTAMLISPHFLVTTEVCLEFW